jgi:hypothetical protein
MFLDIKETRKTHMHIYILLPLLTLSKRRERWLKSRSKNNDKPYNIHNMSMSAYIN